MDLLCKLLRLNETSESKEKIIDVFFASICKTF